MRYFKIIFVLFFILLSPNIYSQWIKGLKDENTTQNSTELVFTIKGLPSPNINGTNYKVTLPDGSSQVFNVATDKVESKRIVVNNLNSGTFYTWKVEMIDIALAYPDASNKEFGNFFTLKTDNTKIETIDGTSSNEWIKGLKTGNITTNSAELIFTLKGLSSPFVNGTDYKLTFPNGNFQIFHINTDATEIKKISISNLSPSTFYKWKVEMITNFGAGNKQIATAGFYSHNPDNSAIKIIDAGPDSSEWIKGVKVGKINNNSAELIFSIKGLPYPYSGGTNYKLTLPNGITQIFNVDMNQEDLNRIYVDGLSSGSFYDYKIEMTTVNTLNGETLPATIGFFYTLKQDNSSIESVGGGKDSNNWMTNIKTANITTSSSELIFVIKGLPSPYTGGTTYKLTFPNGSTQEFNVPMNKIQLKRVAVNNLNSSTFYSWKLEMIGINILDGILPPAVYSSFYTLNNDNSKVSLSQSGENSNEDWISDLKVGRLTTNSAELIFTLKGLPSPYINGTKYKLTLPNNTAQNIVVGANQTKINRVEVINLSSNTSYNWKVEMVEVSLLNGMQAPSSLANFKTKTTTPTPPPSTPVLPCGSTSGDYYTPASYNNSNQTLFYSGKISSNAIVTQNNTTLTFKADSIDLLSGFNTNITDSGLLDIVSFDFSTCVSSKNTLVTIHNDISKENKVEQLENIELNESNIKLFPNPTRNTLNVVLNDSNEEVVMVELIDVVGKLIFSTKENTEINIEHIQSGIYNCIIHTNKKNYFRKIIKLNF